MCSLPGVSGAHLFRPSGDQLPRTNAKLPRTLGIYEYETLDHEGAVAALEAALEEGVKRGIYEPGRSIPAPPEDVFTVDPKYQSAFYNLVSRWPRGQEPRGTEWRLTSKAIFMVFGGPTKPALAEEVLRWYVDWHLDEVCSMPGFISGQLFQPSGVQSPRLTGKVPEILSFWEYEAGDMATTIAAGFDAHLEGMRRNDYEPGISVPGPVEDIWALNPDHQSAFYELVSRWPKDT